MNATTPLNLTMHFDGGCWPNPGGPMNYGWHCETDTGEMLANSRGEIDGHPPEHHTNNVAEYEALFAGLQWLAAFKWAPIDTLTIRGDSQLVVKTINREWNCRKPHLAVLRDACLHELKQIDAGDIVIEWVPRELNAKADALAGSATTESRP